jgi:hypothetical protein
VSGIGSIPRSLSAITNYPNEEQESGAKSKEAEMQPVIMDGTGKNTGPLVVCGTTFLPPKV